MISGTASLLKGISEANRKDNHIPIDCLSGRNPKNLNSSQPIILQTLLVCVVELLPVLPEQVLSVVVAVGSSHYGVDMIA